MDWQVLVLAVVLGSALAPVATTLMERVPGADALRPRPRCASCAAPLAWRDQLPLWSWIALRGRCRDCRAPIGVRHPVAELTCIVATAVVLAQPWPALLTLAWALYVPVGVALAFIDLRHKRLPNLLTLRSAAALVVLLGVAGLVDGLTPWTRALQAGAALFVLYLLMNILARGAMGMGDVKLALAVGLLAGYLGWFEVIAATGLAFVLGGIASAYMLIARRADRRATIPFGPFMLLGLLLVVPLADSLRAMLVP